MSTNLYFFANELKDRWHEVDILIDQAKSSENSNEKLYNVLCRATSVFILAHLEGFYKGLVQSVTADLNEKLKFKDMPSVIKYSYVNLFCEEQKKNQLLSILDNTDIRISADAFLPEKNKNISVDVIDGIFSKMGCKHKTFLLLDVPEIQECFEVGEKTLKEKRDKFSILINETTNCFPYTTNLEEHELRKAKSSVSKKQQGKSFWDTYIEQVNTQRHRIAHGETFDNSDSIKSIEKARFKAEIMQYLLTLYAADHIREIINSTTNPA